MIRNDLDILFEKNQGEGTYFSKCVDCSDNEVINEYLKRLSNIDVVDVIKAMLDNYIENPVIRLESKDVVQFSNIDNSTIKLCEHLKYSGNKGYTFEEVGILLLDRDRKKEALMKYGENQSKTAEMLGLATISEARPRIVYISKLGSEILNLDCNKHEKILLNLMVRVNIVRFIINKAMKGKVYVKEEIDFLSPKTITRRIPNVKKLLSYIFNNSETNLDFLFKDIIYK